MPFSDLANRLLEVPEIQTIRQGWRRLTMAAVALLALTGIFACWCDAPMIWDGAYQFCFSLIKQQPYFYLTRFHSYVLWLPMVYLSRFTDNLTLLKFAYVLPFTLAPAFSVLVSWLIVKDRAPHLIVWAIFGAAAGPLPGQIFIINDSIFQQHMFWPVFMGMLVHLEWPAVLAITLLTPFQFSHQIGAVLLAGAGGAAFLIAMRDREHCRESLVKGIVFTLLACIAVWKALHFRDSWAEQEFTRERIQESWQYGVEGFPLRGIVLMWCAGVGSFAFASLRNSDRRRLRAAIKWSTVVCVLGAALFWTIWAADAHKWTDAGNYRRWVVPLTMPFYLLAFADRWRTVRRAAATDFPAASALSRVIGIGVAGTFALVLSVQCTVWARLTHRMINDVESYPAALVPWDRINWSKDTAIAHWGTTSYVFVLEGRTPRKLLLDRKPAEAEAQTAMLFNMPPKIPLAWFTPVPPAPGPGGWFDFRPLLYWAHHGATSP
jgi:hypothetical protein